jgi:ABC-type Fe3+ transport system permease subunit
MKTHSLRIALLAGLFFCFVLSLIVSASLLPDRVATHFNGAGQADGWMSRSTHLLWMAAFGLLFPTFMIGVFWSTRFLPSSMINIPHRDYWLADERRAETASFLVWHSVWFGCLTQGLVIGIHWLVVLSNQRQPPTLPFLWVMAILAPFFLGIAAWVITLQQRFRAPDVETESLANAPVADSE